MGQMAKEPNADNGKSSPNMEDCPWPEMGENGPKSTEKPRIGLIFHVFAFYVIYAHVWPGATVHVFIYIFVHSWHLAHLPP